MALLNENEDSISSLKVHEWLAIAVVIGIIGGLACLTSFYARGEASNASSESLTHYQQGFDVLVKGAVNHPGIYHIRSEIKLQELLTLAGVALNADLRRFNLETILKKGRVLTVPVRAMINVHLKGAVKQDQTITLPKGSKLEDLIALVNFASNANVNALKKKRRLKSEEVIIVPILQ